ncbi:FUSC family protein [Algoriphagus litoralis]|uniref:FUSC family protein n=1 Tax=Algoriphagus litoralis TaxID=2202829 RepID=UPI000DBA69F0|nr:FUSC family protein [Algoriphagus litoralis]
MTPNELAQLSDQELLEAAKNNKPSPIFDAFFIGFLVGIILFSVFASTWGLVSIIPLFLIYLFLKKPKQYEALKKELARRNLQ